MINTYSKPKRIVLYVTIQQLEKSIVLQQRRKKRLFDVANQAALARQRRVGNVKRVIGADTRQLPKTHTETYHDLTANVINIQILDGTG
jgi:hypothetical protein